MTDGITQIPGFIAGMWKLDPAHSDVGLVVGHLAVSKCTGASTPSAGQS
jgi:polyisoprenoid-binding protein YceI